MTGADPTVDVVRELARFGLDGAGPRAIDWDRVDREALWDRVAVARLGGFLVARARADRESGAMTDEVAAWFDARTVERMTQLNLLELQLVDTVAALDAAGVRVAAVKGPGLARSLYSPHWLRDFGDLDLLVPRDQLGAATRVLEQLGASAVVAPSTQRAAALLGKGTTLRHRLGFELDLHHTLLPGTIGLGVGWDRWLAEPEVVTIAGRSITTLGPLEAAVHLLGHLVIGGPVHDPHIARDVVEALDRVAAVDRIDELFRLVREWELDGLVSAGHRAATEALGCRDDTWDAIVAEVGVPASWARVESRVRAERDSFAVVAVNSLRIHRRPVDRMRIVQALAWPSTAHLAGRGVSRADHLRRVREQVLAAWRRDRGGDPRG